MAALPVRPLLLRMSWPMMLSMLIQALYNLVDSVFVSRLGSEAFEALSLVYPVQMLMVAVCVGTGVGVNSMISRRLGEGRPDRASAVACNGMLLYFLTWVVFALAGLTLLRNFMWAFTSDPLTAAYGQDYLLIIVVGSFGMCWQFAGERILQASGNPVGHMIIQGVGAVFNLIFDPLLIFGIGPFPALGVKGAALATVLGQFLGMAVGLVMVQRSTVLRVRLRGFRPDRESIAEIYRIGLPAIAMQALSTVMTMGMNKILGALTGSGVFILGAYFKLQSFIFMPVFGLSNGLIPPVSFNYGAKQKTRVIGLIRFALVIAVVIMAAGTVLLLLCPGALLGFFDASPAVLAEGIPALRMIGLSFLFAGISIVLSSALQAVSAPVLSLVISLLRQIILLLPAALLLGLFRPSLVWLAFPFAEILSCLLALVFYRRVCRRKILILEDTPS